MKEEASVSTDRSSEKQAFDLGQLTTEQQNPLSAEIDEMSAVDIVRLMNAEDAKIAQAVADKTEVIAAAIDLITVQMRLGGRLIYIGAGTSGRLGVLDASECPPTFSTPPELVVGIIAGGPVALTRAVERAEDNQTQAEYDLQAVRLSHHDVVMGIATSGRTPYVVGGLAFARSIGCRTIAFTCNAQADLQKHAEITIAVVVGPEVISGSTRLKAGTATKMVLNMLSTGTMVRLGKTYGNLMVDLRATNEKLARRSERIVSQLVGIDVEQAKQLLDRCQGEVKTAIVVGRCDVSPEVARQRLAQSEGHLRRALSSDKGSFE